MCVEQLENSMNTHNAMVASAAAAQKSKASYSIKRLLKQLFRSPQRNGSSKIVAAQNSANAKKANSLESLESLENSRNADIECEAECISLESCENDANERLAAASSSSLSCELEDYDFADISSVPVHFLRTAHGTFFWTAVSDVAADNDLIEPLYCGTNNQIATSQLQDRWAQA